MSKLMLSKKGVEFLEDLRVYLFSSGKNSDDIDGILNELEVHLYEAEQSGKPIERIIGNSPKEYMEMLSREMKVDKKAWIKNIILIIAGSFAFVILPDILEGNLAYSVLYIVGHIIIGGILIAVIFTVFKYLSTTNHSKLTQLVIMFGIGILPFSLFFGLIYLDRAIATPVIHFGTTGTLVIGVLTILFIVGFSIWERMWMLIIILSLLILPNYLMTFTPLSYEIQLFVSYMITLGGIAIYMFIITILQKNQEN